MANYNKNINIIFKRHINNDRLKDFLFDLSIDRKYYNIKGKVNNDDLINSINKLNDKKNVIIDKTELDFSNIEQNLKESERLLNTIEKEFSKIKGNNNKIDIEVKEVKIKSDNINIKDLNNQNNLNQDFIKKQEILNQDNTIIQENLDYSNKITSNINKSIWDISWLEPFMNFMKVNSSLILTIGGGIIIGGMWYFNNMGYINIGSLLTRLGIRLFANTPQIQPTTNTIEIRNVPVQPNTANEIGHGFFRQLGVKVLELIDIFIEKMKDKRQKYK